jgi:Membrane protein of 12 TMs
MNAAVRTYQLTKILVVSQLRSGRSKNGNSSILERPAFILAANAIAVLLSWLATFEILSYLPATLGPVVETTTRQVLAFLPMFVLAIVLLAGVMFELNTSSKFASSDLVNWLPISTGEYVAASSISVAYSYSIYLSVAAGVALALSIQAHLLFAWVISCGLSSVFLITGGLLVEILRASVNRAYSIMSEKTGRGALVIRLGLVFVVIVAFQAVFNPTLLLGLMGGLVGALDASFFVPLVWPSLTVFAVVAGDLAGSVVFGLLTTAFSAAVFLTAVVVRSKYWCPSPAAVAFAGRHGYAPRQSRLGALGFSDAEASVVLKDLRGYVRRKELLGFLAMPFVFAIIFVIQYITGSSFPGVAGTPWTVVLFTGFSAIFFSASSIGIEGKSFLNVYLVPLDPRELVRAKAFSSLLLALGGALTMSAVAAFLFVPNLGFLLKVLVVSVAVSIQSVFVGLCIATRYSDFAERPRPRYVSMSGMLKALVVGVAASLVASSPILLLFESQPLPSLLISAALFSFISALAYRYSLKGAEALMEEMKG